MPDMDQVRNIPLNQSDEERGDFIKIAPKF